ncbi:pectin lyase-like protein [Serendipita vermifera]|nr:pectin lyase-like protein [Serendipita vermifera]
MKWFALVNVFVALLAPHAATAIGSPPGFATGTTGGAAGATVTPTTEAQLITYLSDSTARTIVLTKIFDFTSYYGSVTGGCEGKTLYSVSYYNSGQNKNLAVGSNKTLLGKGNNAGLKGIGLRIIGSTNVIIQNIKITDLNPHIVWGGDGIYIGNSSKVWIDHCYFARMGRQFITTGFDPNSSITISNNFFNGQSTYSVSCNGMHYWAFIFAGKTEQITFIYNRIYHTSGRGPHAGGGSGFAGMVHIVNNYYQNVGGHAIDAGTGSIILTEGNYFESVTTPDTGTSSGGAEYFVQTVAEAGVCASFASSRTVATRATTSVLTSFGAYSVVKTSQPRASLRFLLTSSPIAV